MYSYEERIRAIKLYLKLLAPQWLQQYAAKLAAQKKNAPHALRGNRFGTASLTRTDVVSGSQLIRCLNLHPLSKLSNQLLYLCRR
jgi:hypothetical protein